MHPPRGPHTSHLRRELWPVHDPALVGEWPHIVRSTATYFDSIPQPLVLVAARLSPPSFSAYEIDVMITERPGNHLLAYRLRGLRPEDYPIDSYHHTFTSTPSLAIAPLNLPGVEGTTSVFYHREGDKKDVLAITACHVACGLPASPNGTSHLEPGREIVHLGPVAFAKAESDILRRLVTIDSQVKGYKQDPYGVEASIERMQHQIVPLTSCTVKSGRSPVLEGRVIGNVLHADPIAEGPEGHTVDWAAIKVAKESVDWETFLGNKVYVGAPFCPAASGRPRLTTTLSCRGRARTEL
ncbi:hypothetical protein BKA70DRAFT_1306936 [Coprinopsis sp. MPI-PUGE-AT-0042]|nr:hypothetical protein BKA70DRAFT_1306936 [Coprinopsis sp. MPI-PUGE-AT-0042]